MLKAVSTYIYIKERLHPGLLDGLVRNGAQAIEIFASRSHLDYANRRQHVKEIAEWFHSSGVPLNSMHSPMYSGYEWRSPESPPVNIASPDRKTRVEAMDEIKRALEVAEQVPFRFLIQHMGLPNEEFDDAKFEACMTSVEHLRAFAKPLGVMVLLENIPNELSTPGRIRDFLHQSRIDDVGVCLDLGHAHVMGGVPEAFATLKHRIRSVHVHDNKGDRDAHLWPGEGSINWKEALGLLRSAPHDPSLVLEIDGEEKANIGQGVSDAIKKLGEFEQQAAS
jgi:sugar phosphate isomerase/epimerase